MTNQQIVWNYLHGLTVEPYQELARRIIARTALGLGLAKSEMEAFEGEYLVGLSEFEITNFVEQVQ